MVEGMVKFGIKIDGFDEGQVSFGFGLSTENYNGKTEVYAWFNLFKFCVNIGWFSQ
jgi:hypothetical protein